MSDAIPAGGEPRALRALRLTLLAAAAACVVLGVLGSALVLLAGDADPWPGLSLLLVAQAVALAAAAAAALGLRRARQALRADLLEVGDGLDETASPPRPVPAEVTAAATGVRLVLGWLIKALAVLLVLGVTAWVLIRPDAWLATLACALVASQLLVVLRYLRG